MKTKIYTPSVFGGLRSIDTDLSPKELLDLRQEYRSRILEGFHWEYYPPSMKHLIIMAEFQDGSAIVYTCGYMMTDDDFYARMEEGDIVFADVLHRL